MKAEVKQVVRGVSYAAQSAAIMAETSGEFTAYAVGFCRTLGREALLQCTNTEAQKTALQGLIQSSKFEDKVAAGDLAAHALMEKWSAE